MHSSVVHFFELLMLLRVVGMVEQEGVFACSFSSLVCLSSAPAPLLLSWIAILVLLFWLCWAVQSFSACG